MDRIVRLGRSFLTTANASFNHAVAALLALPMAVRALLFEACAALGGGVAADGHVAERWADRLEQEWLDSFPQLQALHDVQWARLGLPARLEAELRRRLGAAPAQVIAPRESLSGRRRLADSRAVAPAQRGWPAAKQLLPDSSPLVRPKTRALVPAAEQPPPRSPPPWRGVVRLGSAPGPQHRPVAEPARCVGLRNLAPVLDGGGCEAMRSEPAVHAGDSGLDGLRDELAMQGGTRWAQVLTAALGGDSAHVDEASLTRAMGAIGAVGATPGQLRVALTTASPGGGAVSAGRIVAVLRGDDRARAVGTPSLEDRVRGSEGAHRLAAKLRIALDYDDDARLRRRSLRGERQGAYERYRVGRQRLH